MDPHYLEVKYYISLMSLLDKFTITLRTSSLPEHRKGPRHPSINRDVDLDFVVKGKISVSDGKGTIGRQLIDT